MRQALGTNDVVEGRVFYFLILLHLLPIWLFEYFPTQDGPAHLYNARIIGEWYWSGFEVFREYLSLNERFDPTWFTHLILAGLMKVLSPEMSQKLFLTLHVVAFPVSIRYALGAVGGQARFLAVLGFPFIYSAIFHFGFFSFSVSMAVYCFFIGYWVRHVESIRWLHAAVLVLLSTLLYFTHVITMAMAYGSAAVIAGTLWIVYVWTSRREGRLDVRSLGGASWKGLIKPGLTLLPAMTLLLVFVSDRQRTLIPGPDLAQRVRDFVTLRDLYVFQPRELVLSTFLGAVLWALTVWFVWQACKHRRWERADVLLVLVMAITGVFFLAPEPLIGGENGALGGGFIVERLNSFPFLIILLWLGSRQFTGGLRRAVHIGGIGMALIFLTVHMTQYSRITRQLDEYLSAIDKVESGSTLLPLVARQGGVAPNGDRLSHRVDPFLHASNLGGAERPILILLNYEAGLGYFPVRFQPTRNPYVLIGPIENAPPTVNILDFAKSAGGRIDYVLVWLGRDQNGERSGMRSVYEQFDLEYRRVFVSRNGLAELFQRIAIEE